MPPMATHFGTQDGYVSEQLKGYYEERARRGAGIIIVEFTVVDPAGRSLPCQLSVYDDKFISGLSELARVIQKHGAKAENKLAEQLGGIMPEIYKVGDCFEPHSAREATDNSATVALKI